MKKTIFTVITIFTMFFFMNDVKAISCSYEVKVNNKTIKLNITEKRQSNCTSPYCSVMHDYRFNFPDGTTSINNEGTYKTDGKTYKFKFYDFSDSEHLNENLQSYINDKTRSCPNISYETNSNQTKYTFGKSGKYDNELKSTTKPQANSKTATCSYNYDSAGNKLPHTVTLNAYDSGTNTMSVNGKELKIGEKTEFESNGIKYTYVLVNTGDNYFPVSISNSCPKKLTATIEKTDKSYVLSMSNGKNGNSDIYTNNPKDSNSGNSGEGAGLNANNDCESLLGKKTTDWLKGFLKLIQIAGPFIALILGMLDFVNAVLSSEDGAIKKAWGKFIRRIIAAIALIILPAIIDFILEATNITSNGTCGIK